MKEKLILSITILLASVILGGFYYTTQINKQKSIEKQQQIKIEIAKQVLEKEERGIKKEEDEKRKREVLYNFCIKDAENNYWNYMELNGTGKRDNKKGINAYQYIWDIADKRKQQEIENCFNQYKK